MTRGIASGRDPGRYRREGVEPKLVVWRSSLPLAVLIRLPETCGRPNGFRARILLGAHEIERSGIGKRAMDQHPPPTNDTAALVHLALSITALTPSDEPNWAAVTPTFLDLAQSHRVLGILPTARMWMALPRHIREQARVRHRSVSLRMMRQLAVWSPMLAQCRDEGLPVVLTKGSALALHLYGRWDARGAAADLDIIVDPDRLHEADRLLRRHGYVSHTEPRNDVMASGVHSWYRRWLHYEHSYGGPNGTTVDVHWRLMPGAATWNQFLTIHAESVETPLPDGVYLATGPVHDAIVCFHQGQLDDWPDLRRCVDALVAWSQCDQAARATLRTRYRAVDSALAAAERQLRRTLSSPYPPNQSRQGRLRHYRRFYEALNQSGSPLAAPMRGALGLCLPARRLPAFGTGTPRAIPAHSDSIRDSARHGDLGSHS